MSVKKIISVIVIGIEEDLFDVVIIFINQKV